MTSNAVLSIMAQGAWNGGKLIDNSCFENSGMSFKNKVPVNSQTIEERIGVRTRVAAPEDERIGVSALENLLKSVEFDSTKIKWLIGATNVGEDKNDPGPLVRFPLEVIKKEAPGVIAIDLYAGCPGFNVATELLFMLSIDGVLSPDDLSVIVGAENIHRAKAFRSNDTASLIFGDDALASLFQTHANSNLTGQYHTDERVTASLGNDPVDATARAIFELIGNDTIDGLIVDNHLGKIEWRVPAFAARVQHRLTELQFPDEAQKGLFNRFKDALSFYDERVGSFAFDIMSQSQDPHLVKTIAGAYVRSGKYHTVVSAFAGVDNQVNLTVHRGVGYTFPSLTSGVLDTATSTHGCFGAFIQASFDDGEDEVFGEMDGKGVFLYATRGADRHLKKLLKPIGMTIENIDLLIEHQANFAMIPLTLEQLFKGKSTQLKKDVAAFIANKMVINVHTRGNCSVVCMQRLPYDLQRNALKSDTIQGIPINRNLEQLKLAKVILYDSVGAGMTRSSFIHKLP